MGLADLNRGHELLTVPDVHLAWKERRHGDHARLLRQWQAAEPVPAG
jgi:hypothetical protein